jgi:hypothetical protein
MGMESQLETAWMVDVAKSVENRRRTERVEVSLPIRVSSNGEAGRFEEICKTLNASCEGLYFVSKIQCYKVGMPVVVAFPHSLETEPKVHFFGKVVRVERLSDHCLGIAVELLVRAAPFQVEEFRHKILR